MEAVLAAFEHKIAIHPWGESFMLLPRSDFARETLAACVAAVPPTFEVEGGGCVASAQWTSDFIATLRESGWRLEGPLHGGTRSA